MTIIIIILPILRIPVYIQLTDNHQCEFETLLYRFPVNLIRKIGKAHVALWRVFCLNGEKN